MPQVQQFNRDSEQIPNKQHQEKGGSHMNFIPTTQVRLLESVPLTKDYQHTRFFSGLDEQRDWFQAKTSHHFNDFSYVKEDNTIKVPKVRDVLYNCNYLMFRNENFAGRWFYAFITNLEYVNPNTTKVHYEIDVFQTWYFYVRWKPTFIEREHTKRWHEDGSPVVNTIDEGLDYGTDYETVQVLNYKPYGGYKWLVIVTKTPIDGDNPLNEPKGSVIGSPQPLSYYIHPFKDNNHTPAINLDDGTPVPLSMPTWVLDTIYKDKEAVNNVVALFVTEYTGIPVTFTEGSPDKMTFPKNENKIVQAIIGGASGAYTLKVTSAYTFSALLPDLDDNKYWGYNEVIESKLLMHPYCTMIMDDFKGNRIEYKPEYIGTKGVRLRIKGSLGLSNKVSYAVDLYNRSNTPTDNEYALIDNNPNDLPIINDYLSAFIQGNKNTLENQKDTILFNGLMDTLTAGGNAVMGGVMGAVFGGGVGAMGGAISGIASGVKSAGNMSLQIQGLTAKVKDIKNTPPNIAKMGGNTSYTFGNKYNGVYLIKKQIPFEQRKRLGDYFKMYGYKVNELKIPNLRSRWHFNYIKTIGANLYGDVPQDDLQLIKNIFDNGLTLWHMDDVGNYAYDNWDN